MTSAVTVFEPKPKTAVLYRNQTETAVFWWLCDGFSQISKMVQPDHKCL